MLVAVAAFVANAESQKPRRLTQAVQIRKCRRSPLHRAAAYPLQQLRTHSKLSALKMFWKRWARMPLCCNRQLEGEVQTATEHSEIVFRPIDHAEAQVVSPTNMPRDSELEAGSKLAEHFGFGAEVIRLCMDSERIRRPLRVNDIPFATAENRAHSRPCIGQQTCARNRIP